MKRGLKTLCALLFTIIAFASSLASAASVASCSLNGNFKTIPGAKGQVCWTEICCNSGKTGPGNYWMAGIPSMAAAACSTPKARLPGQPAVGGTASAACGPSTLDWANQKTLTAMVQGSAAAGRYPVDAAQCRYDQPCD